MIQKSKFVGDTFSENMSISTKTGEDQSKDCSKLFQLTV